MGSNNVLLTSVNIGPAAPGLSGDGTVATITPDAVGSAQDGLFRKVLSQMANPGGVLVYTTYPQDPAFKVLMDLYNSVRASGGTIPLSGQASSLHAVYTWRAAIFTDLPAFNREEEATTVTFTLALDGLDTVAL